MDCDTVREYTEAKRFLFIMSDTGSGHRSSALAVRDEMRRLYGDRVLIDVADIFIESSLWPFYKFPAWYAGMVRLQSVPYGAFFHATDHPWIAQTAAALMWPYTRRALSLFLGRHPADVIVSFHPVPNFSVARAVRQAPASTRMVIVAVDLVTVHASYFAPGALAYFVPTPEARRRALRRGAPADRIEVMGGMPVRPAFVEARRLSKEEARRRLGLPDDQPIVLLMGGGDGMGSLDVLVTEIAKRRPAARLVAIAGRNRNLYRKLSSLALPIPLHVEGFSPHMELWMRSADVLLTKAGPNTLNEACVVGLPMVIYASLRGQEEGNAKFVAERGAGIWAPGPRKAADALMNLLTDPARRQAMAERARTAVNPGVASMLAGRLWEIAKTGDAPIVEDIETGLPALAPVIDIAR